MASPPPRRRNDSARVKSICTSRVGLRGSGGLRRACFRSLLRNEAALLRLAEQRREERIVMLAGCWLIAVQFEIRRFEIPIGQGARRNVRERRSKRDPPPHRSCFPRVENERNWDEWTRENREQTRRQARNRFNSVSWILIDARQRKYRGDY